MGDHHTSIAVQHYLDHLLAARDEAEAEEIVRSLLGRSFTRLHLLCATFLRRAYPRLSKPPLNLETEDILSSVVERLLKAMRKVRPNTVRQFFSIANQHIRWELNDAVRRLDKMQRTVELHESAMQAAPEDSGSGISPICSRLLEAIEGLPDDEREAFSLVRIQGMMQTEAAEVIGVSVKTVQRRIDRSVVLLAAKIGDLAPPRENAAGP